MNGSGENRPPALQVPTQLVEGLRGLHNQTLFVPSEVDQAILARAREHLSAQAQQPRVILVPRWLAAAAAVAIGVWLTSVWIHRPSPLRTYAREDLDHNGHVDILDAFALSRRVQQASPDSGSLDINGDGVVDQKDIDAVAAKAVKLSGGHG